MDDEARRRLIERLAASREAGANAWEDPAEKATRDVAANRWGRELGRRWAIEEASYEELRRLGERCDRPDGLFRRSEIAEVEMTQGATLAGRLIRQVSRTAIEPGRAGRFWAWRLGMPTAVARPLLNRISFVAGFAAGAAGVWEQVRQELGD
ncbi:hypothetical protein [Tautonia plasticadhaerens]|uniref:Uncharacterized protein n=1 Tax=Tautonia plasticadhaerens TaxID=2527974 RepID=A0A518HEY4_9BACT|nr:hypothetical protein [Tautonia plasticadhaerens]QDV39394.1 hypothetical protein ElP_73610 [Tautonia plasticadhaerens]